jgi:hypothetical protein
MVVADCRRLRRRRGGGGGCGEEVMAIPMVTGVGLGSRGIGGGRAKPAVSLGRWGFHGVARIFSFRLDRKLKETTLPYACHHGRLSVTKK